MNFVLSLSFGFGLAFQIPIIVNALISLRITSKTTIKKYRGFVLVMCFVFGMIFTPPDIVSQFMMAIPMYVLFEMGLLFSYEKEKESNS
jgi:sec-independent protein translocase protein TatC